jgi:GDP-4-dehydro-6-deoxy-D-mannose reductase
MPFAISWMSLKDSKGTEIVNVCTGEGRRLFDLTQRLIDISGVHVELQHDVSRRGNSDVKAFVGDPSRLKALGLDFAGTDIDSVLEEILRSARASLGAN